MDAVLKNAFAPGHHVRTDTVPVYEGLSAETAGFDIDGVIADTMRLFVDIARDSFQIDDLRYEDITSYNLEECLDLDPATIDAIIAQIIDGTHAPQLHAMAGCCDIMARFGASGHPVRFVTARPEEGVIRTWLENILPLKADQIQVVATGSFDAKATVLREDGIQVFVEDRLETCFLLSRAGITPILFAQPWNRRPHPFREVSSWEEISSLLAT